MASIRFIMLGGFLGAGKTTTLARLARHYMSQGLRVGLVTNRPVSKKSVGTQYRKSASQCFSHKTHSYGIKRLIRASI